MIIPRKWAGYAKAGPIALLAVGAIWLLFGGGAGFVAPIATLLSWLGTISPLPPRYAPWFAFFAFFMIASLAVLPFELTHVRVNRSTGNVTLFSNSVEAGMSVIFAEGTCLVLLALACRVAPHTAFADGTERFALLLPASGWIIKIAVSILMASCWLGLLMGTLAVDQFWCRLHKEEEDPFLYLQADSQTESSFAPVSFSRPVLYLLVLIIASVICRMSPLFLTLAACFVAARLIAYVVCLTVSRRMDCLSDRWLRELAAGWASGDESSRLAAVRRLGQLRTHYAASYSQWSGKKPIPVVDRALRTALNDLDRSVSGAAAWALRRSGPVTPEAVAAVIEGLSDPDPTVRMEAAEVLCRMGAPAAASVPALGIAVGDPDTKVSKKAVETLAAMGPAAAAAVPALMHAVIYEHAIRNESADALAAVGAAAVPELTSALHEEDRHIREAVAEALGKIGPPAAAAAPALAAELTKNAGGDWLSRRPRTYAHALAAIGVAAVPELVSALQDKDSDVRKATAEALGRIGPAAVAAVPGLVSALGHRDSDFRKAVAEALGEIGPAAVAAVPALVAALGDPNHTVRSEALKALTAIDPATAKSAPVLIRALRHAEWIKERETLGDAIVLVGAPAVPDLILALRDKESDVREAAAEALGRIGHAAAQAIPALTAALNDPDVPVRFKAADALNMIQSPSSP